MRSIVAHIAETKKNKKRFHHGNAARYREEIDAVSLDVLTIPAIQKWRKQFVESTANNPAARKRARISCDSVLRQARSLFSKKKILKFIALKLPEPLPFSESEFYPGESMRYQSEIDPAVLLPAAVAELREDSPEIYKVVLLALGAALRRNEIDKLQWEQIDFERQVIHVKVTADGRVKNKASESDVAMDDFLCGELKKLSGVAKSRFVIEGPVSDGKKMPYIHEYTLSRAVEWLRKHGMKASKPIHSLRKEAGSIVNEESGIHAASSFLRHSDLQVTDAHYADRRKKVTVNMAKLVAPLPAVEPAGTCAMRSLKSRTQRPSQRAQTWRPITDRCIEKESF